MKLYFLGTCAGTEPMPTCRHSSFALETEGKIYWFDAGEGCSYTAHNMGIDLLAVSKIIISHAHMDHVGGLGNLLWNIRKLCNVKKAHPAAERIEVYIPNLQTWDGLMMLLRNTEGDFKTAFDLTAHETQEGVLFDDGSVKVSAYHNTHIPARDGKWLSYSFRIECAGKRIVYSGDVKSYAELDPVIGEGCDALIIETGHFGIDDVYTYVKDKSVGRIFFTHNGREILSAPEVAALKVRQLLGDKAFICHDGLVQSL